MYIDVVASGVALPVQSGRVCVFLLESTTLGEYDPGGAV